MKKHGLLQEHLKKKRRYNISYYTFEEKETGVEFIYDVPMAELDVFLLNNPQIRQIITPIKIVSGRPVQVDGGFRDVLSKIKSDYPRSTINVPGIKQKPKNTK